MLTQTEADTLIAMEKRFEKPRTVLIPLGVDETFDLIGKDVRERFLFDVWRGTFRLTKLKFQTRGRKIIVLVRVDIDGAPHTNPDGQSVGGTHIHRYREGYEDKWAEPLDAAEFANPADIDQTYHDFCRICNIVDVPSFQPELI